MRSKGPSPRNRTGHYREFANEIIEAEGEWVEMAAIPEEIHGQQMYEYLGRALAEVTIRQNVAYGRLVK